MNAPINSHSCRCLQTEMFCSGIRMRNKTNLLLFLSWLACLMVITHLGMLFISRANVKHTRNEFTAPASGRTVITQIKPAWKVLMNSVSDQGCQVRNDEDPFPSQFEMSHRHPLISNPGYLISAITNCRPFPRRFFNPELDEAYRQGLMISPPSGLPVPDPQSPSQGILSF